MLTTAAGETSKNNLQALEHHRTTEYSELEGTDLDYQVQLPALHRAAPKITRVRSLSKLVHELWQAWCLLHNHPPYQI